MTAAETVEAICADILPMRGPERVSALLSWRRSIWFDVERANGDDWIAALHREAWQTMHRTLMSDLPAVRWMRAGHQRHRAAIATALRIDPSEPTAGYATYPFRVIRDDEQNWIAAAVGCTDPDVTDAYADLDIADVVLWNPRTGTLRILGEPTGGAVGPTASDDTMTIYGDGFAFMRAWAERRAEYAARARQAVAKRWAHPAPLPADGGLPGVLVVGDIAKAKLPQDVAVLRAGPGTSADALRKAVFRQARLPRVQAMAA